MPSSIKDLMSVMRTSVACLELAYILQRTPLRVTSTSMASVAAQAAPLTKTAPAMCATGTLIIHLTQEMQHKQFIMLYCTRCFSYFPLC